MIYFSSISCPAETKASIQVQATFACYFSMVIGVAIFFVLAFVFDISFLHYFCLFIFFIFCCCFFMLVLFYFLVKGGVVCLIFLIGSWFLGGGVVGFFLTVYFCFFLFWPLYIYFFTFSKKMFLFGFCLFILLFFI